MKKPLIAFAVVTALTASTVHADASTPVRASPEAHRLQMIGLGVGSVAGALVAGPAGLVAGSIVGSLLGWNGGLQDDLNKNRQELEHAQAELATLESRHRVHVAGVGTPAPPGTGIEGMVNAGLVDTLTADLGLDIHFRSGSDAIEPYYEQRLAALVALLNAFPQLAVTLEGYADRRGSGEDNMQLSSLRLSSVKAVLIAAGIDPQRIRETALGESKPVSKPGDAQAYAFDRRVQLRLSTGQPGTVLPVAQVGSGLARGIARPTP